MDTKTFDAGEVIFREGDDSEEAYRILEGEVEISLRTPYGPRVLSHLHQGEIFGEMGLANELPRSATATARKSTNVEIITAENFTQSVLADRDRLNDYLATLFERLRTTDIMLQMELRRKSEEGEQRDHSLETALVAAVESGEEGVPAGTVTLASQYHKRGFAAPEIKAEIEKFPFRIGRLDPVHGATPFVNNDLLVPDDKPYQISRNHCMIERHDGGVFMRDRGSTLGTIVNGRELSVRAGEIAVRLSAGDNELILGSQDGPHHFVVTVG